jgi:hypothetical protein
MARMGEGRGAYRFLIARPEGESTVVNLGYYLTS